MFFFKITIIFEDFCANYISTLLQGKEISISIGFVWGKWDILGKMIHVDASEIPDFTPEEDMQKN